LGKNEADRHPAASGWNKGAASNRDRPERKGRCVLKRLVAAAARAFLVALLIVLPATILPDVSADTAQMMALLSLLAAVLTFVEYVAVFPSLIEFRSAPPFNRMRFVALFVTVLALSLINRAQVYDSTLGSWLIGIGTQIGAAMDFPFSPVRLMVLIAPQGVAPGDLDMIRTHTGLAYLVSLVSILLFVALVRLMDWPIRNGAFNFYVNLPLFDPTAGGDILHRLKRDSHVNVALGFLLPFLIPAILKTVTVYGTPLNTSEPQTLIWIIAAWAFLPASLIMRGVALMRIADLIEEKRRRAYAQAELQVA
jgi:hypothetical protein